MAFGPKRKRGGHAIMTGHGAYRPPSPPAEEEPKPKKARKPKKKESDK